MMVYLVEDSPVIRERLHDMVLELDPCARVIEASSASEAIAGIVEMQPDLVVLDLKLAGGSGLEVLRETDGKLPANRVVVFTSQASGPYRKKCVAMGAAGFFDKAQDFERIRDVVRRMSSSALAATDNWGDR